jgi:hypothetical protein
LTNTTNEKATRKRSLFWIHPLGILFGSFQAERKRFGIQVHYLVIRPVKNACQGGKAVVET